MMTPATHPPTLEKTPEFSLVLGGGLFRLFHKAHLSGDALELAYRRILVLVLITWVPLLVLSAMEGAALGGTLRIPFLYDIETHVRLLVALPCLIAGERVVHLRMQTAVRRFADRGIVVPEDMAKFNAAIRSTMRVSGSVALEVGLLILVAILGQWIWRTYVALDAGSWYARPQGAGGADEPIHLTLAGRWNAFVSITVFQFILMRWYLRMILWLGFLGKVSRLNLRLVATHPDRTGGIGFLGTSSFAFGPVLFAQGALLSGLIANRIFYDGHKLLDYKLEAAAFVLFFVTLVLGPLLVFMPSLALARRQGLRDYGLLASRYVDGFDRKWIGPSASGELLGSPDIQSLADMGNSYAVVREMRIVPFGTKQVVSLAAVAAVPLVPLLLTMFSLEELVVQLIKVLF